MINTALRVIAPVSMITPQRLFEIIGLVGVAKLLLGMWLNWKIAWLSSDVEEAAKDGKMTESSARARIRFYNWFFPALIVMGVGMIGIALLGLSE